MRYLLILPFTIMLLGAVSYTPAPPEGFERLHIEGILSVDKSDMDEDTPASISIRELQPYGLLWHNLYMGRKCDYDFLFEHDSYPVKMTVLVGRYGDREIYLVEKYLIVDSLKLPGVWYEYDQDPT